MNYVAVGEDEAVRCEDEAGASAAALAIFAGTRPTRRGMNFDVHDRGADLLDGICHRTGVGVEEWGIGVGDCAGAGRSERKAGKSIGNSFEMHDENR